jgi:hypothetical protein
MQFRNEDVSKLFEDFAGGLILQPNGAKWSFYRKLLFVLLTYLLT